MPDYRETIIRLDHGDQTVSIWTQERSILRKLDKAKAPLDDTHSGQEWRKVPMDRFRWKILGKRAAVPATAAQLAALAKARLAQGRP